MRQTIGLIGLLVLTLLAVVALAQAPPDEIMLDAAAEKKAGVLFPHAAHVELVDSCVTCHHTDEGLTADSAEGVEPCSACHLNPEGDVPSMAEMSLTKNPLHANCINCHKEQDKGPIKCNDCHVKE